jgi:hypothetical protein
MNYPIFFTYPLLKYLFSECLFVNSTIADANFIDLNLLPDLTDQSE